MQISKDEETRIRVEVLATAGVPHDQIASIIGMAKNTLYAHYRAELDDGLARTVANLANTLVQKAMNGDNTCLIFFLKTKGRDFGWCEGGEVQGKKEQRANAAKEAVKSFPVPPAPPGLARNN